jgi:hypothetical protein
VATDGRMSDADSDATANATLAARGARQACEGARQDVLTSKKAAP